ncbi:hypothetical protein QF026_001261 [Streptomyces aurantiacus]|uniref:hypothetical protein n=1 Tax=Streptomyces aurantiacus TaxID=47760 RepID=UPI002793F2F8|nr:hypothetical protein [Streptomyces aurantiacus]MDQ0772795.1 hypothetical protein [Streptomyces aurantiacus]
MTMRRRVFLATTGAVAVAAGGTATANAGTDLSASATSGGTAAPVSRMSELSFFSGRWRGTGTFFLSASGNPKPIIMEIQNGTGYDGFWSTTHTTERKTAENPDPLTAVYLWGYDPDQDVFVAEWFDSRGGRATQRSLGWDGNRFVFLGTMTSGGSTFTLRDTFVRHDKNSYHHIGEADFGSGWVAVDEEEVRRR